MYEKKKGRPSEAQRMGLKILIVELGEIHDNYKDVAMRIGGNPGSIYKCLSDDFGQETHKGYHFEWVENVDESSPWD